MKSYELDLRRTDEETAEQIASEYPADWDMSRVFERSYRKFLADSEPENGDILEYQEAEPAVRRPTLTFGRLAAAACVLLTAALVTVLAIRPDRIEDRPDVIEILPVITSVVTVTGTSPVTSVTAVSSVTETVQVTAEPDIADIETQPVTVIPEETEPPTEPPTEPEMTTTQRVTGVFRVNPGGYSGTTTSEGFDEIVYHFEGEPPEPKVHTPDIEGYTLDSVTEKEPGYCEYTMTENETGASVYVAAFSYERFRVGMNPNTHYTITELDINGRPAFWTSQSDGENSPIFLYWDDGCHICMRMGQRKNLDKMIHFAENFNTEEET